MARRIGDWVARRDYSDVLGPTVTLFQLRAVFVCIGRDLAHDRTDAQSAFWRDKLDYKMHFEWIAPCEAEPDTELSHLHTDGQQTLSIVDGESSTTSHGLLRIVHRQLPDSFILGNARALLGEPKTCDDDTIRWNLST